MKYLSSRGTWGSGREIICQIICQWSASRGRVEAGTLGLPWTTSHLASHLGWEGRSADGTCRGPGLLLWLWCQMKYHRTCLPLGCEGKTWHQHSSCSGLPDPRGSRGEISLAGWKPRWESKVGQSQTIEGLKVKAGASYHYNRVGLAPCPIVLFHSFLHSKYS